MSYLVSSLIPAASTSPHYQGKDHSIFFWSRAVAAGDKIGWDFINRTLTSRLAFSAYCLDITQVYQSSHPNSNGIYVQDNICVMVFFHGVGA